MGPAGIDSSFRRNDGWGGVGMVVGGSRYDGEYDHTP